MDQANGREQLRRSRCTCTQAWETAQSPFGRSSAIDPGTGHRGATHRAWKDDMRGRDEGACFRLGQVGVGATAQLAGAQHPGQ